MGEEWLKGQAAMDRSNQLGSNGGLGRYFESLANTVHESSGRIEVEYEYADGLDSADAAANVAQDIERELHSLYGVSNDFQQAVNAAMPAIIERIKIVVSDHIRDGKFCGSGQHVRQYIAANVGDVVGTQLKL